MSIADELTTLANTKQAFKTALSGKGIDLTGKKFSDYPNLMTSAMSTGLSCNGTLLQRSAYYAGSQKTVLTGKGYLINLSNTHINLDVIPMSGLPNIAWSNVIIKDFINRAGNSNGYNGWHIEGRLEILTSSGFYRSKNDEDIPVNNITNIDLVISSGVPALKLNGVPVGLDKINSNVHTYTNPDIWLGWDDYNYYWDNHSFVGAINNFKVCI